MYLLIRPSVFQHRVGLLLSLFLILGLNGCSSLSWLGGDDSPRKPASLTDFRPTLATKQLWTINVGAKASIGFQPIAILDSIYAAAADGNVVNIDAKTGRIIWRNNLGIPLSAGVGGNSENIAVVATTGEIILLNTQDGQIKWKKNFPGEVLTPPIVAEGLVVIRTTDYRFTAFDLDTGQRRWSLQRQSPSLALRASSRMSVLGDLLFTGFPGGRLAAISLTNGIVRWDGVIAPPRGTTELERVTEVVGAPIISGREICAVSFQGRIACFDLNSGNPTWGRNFSGISGLAIDPRYAFAADESSVVYGFSRDGGANLWKQEALKNRMLSNPASVGRALAIGDFQGYIHWLAREDGKLLARTSTDGTAVISSPLVDDQSIIIQNASGSLFALGLEG